MSFDRLRLQLCFIVDVSENCDEWFADASRVVGQGVTTLFLRFRSIHRGPRIMEFVGLIRDRCGEVGAYCFVFDDPLLALSQSLDGVIFSQTPGNLMRIREAIGFNLFIGLQVNGDANADSLFTGNSYDLIDFAAVGPVLHRGGKHKDCIGIAKAQSLTRRLSPKPVVWLGGIFPAELTRFSERFADGVAVSRGLTDSSDGEAVDAYLAGLGAAISGESSVEQRTVLTPT